MGVDRWGAVATWPIAVATIEPEQTLVPAGEIAKVSGEGYTAGEPVTVTVRNDNGTPGDTTDDPPAYPCYRTGSVVIDPETGELTASAPVTATNPDGLVTADCPIPFDAPAGNYYTTATTADGDPVVSVDTFEVATPPLILVNNQKTPTSAVPPALVNSDVPVTGLGFPTDPATPVVLIATGPDPDGDGPEEPQSVRCVAVDGDGEPLEATVPITADTEGDIAASCPIGSDPGTWTIAAFEEDGTTPIANPRTGNIVTELRVLDPTITITNTDGDPNTPDVVDVPSGTPIQVKADDFFPGEVVTVTVTDPDTNEVVGTGTGTVCADTSETPSCEYGTLTITVPTPEDLVEDGEGRIYTVTAVGEDSDRPVTTTVNITDGMSPAAPVITGPTTTADVPTKDNTPTITGTGEPGATVEITPYVDDDKDPSTPKVPLTYDHDNDAITPKVPVPPCETTVQADGTWSCTMTTPLPEGLTDLVATQTDEATNESDPTAPFPVYVDTIPPARPVITTPAGPTTENQPPITGTGEPGAIVTVTDNGTSLTCAVVPVVVAPNGTWTCTPLTPMSDGDHTIVARQTDPAGNTSLTSTPVTITVDTSEPKAPAIDKPAGPTNDTTPEITGTGEPGSTVTVSDGGTPIACDEDPVVVADDGTWVCTPTIPLPPGDHPITATQTDPAGNKSPVSDAVTITVDTTVLPPVITTPGGLTNDPTPTVGGTGEPGSTVTVTDGPTGPTICTATVQQDGTWSCDLSKLVDGDHTITATQTDPAGNTSGPGTKVITVDTEKPPAPKVTGPTDTQPGGSKPAIEGTGTEPGNDVTVQDQDGNTVCTATVQPGGAWSCTPDEPLPNGTTTVTATETDPAGNASDPSGEFDVVVDGTPPAKPVITPPTGPTNDTTPSIKGTGEPGATVTVTDNGTPVTCAEAPVVVAADGSWTCTPTNPMSDGDHTITATQTDPSGNTSPASDPVTITVDTKVVPPVITPPTGPTNDSTPPITGTGEPGSKVTVTDDDGATVCTATVQADGSWSCSPSTPLPDGDHPLTATQTDPAGNTSTPSAPVTVTVDTTPPAAPAITGPAGPTADPTPTITGTGEPGATVTVTDGDGTTVCTATVQPDGTWSCTPTTPLSDGDHTLTATQTDPAGNTSPPSDPLTVTVDTSTPTLTVPSGPVNAGTDVPISGAGYTPGETVTVTITDDAGNPVGDPVTVTVGPDGTFATTVYVSGYTTPGTYTVTATGETSGITASVPIQIAARVIVSWHEYPVRHRGDTQVYRARGFEPGERVTAVIRSTPIYLPVTVADADGIATWTFTVPADFELDRHSGTATSVPVGDSHTAYFRVVAENLAPTGVSETLLHIAAAAVLMFTTGALLVRKTLKEQR